MQYLSTSQPMQPLLPLQLVHNWLRPPLRMAGHLHRRPQLRWLRSFPPLAEWFSSFLPSESRAGIDRLYDSWEQRHQLSFAGKTSRWNYYSFLLSVHATCRRSPMFSHVFDTQKRHYSWIFQTLIWFRLQSIKARHGEPLLPQLLELLVQTKTNIKENDLIKVNSKQVELTFRL